MDKETLSNYGWIVIAVLVLVVMIALATPFGTFVSEAVQSTTKGLFDVNKSALDSTGLINIDNQEFDVPDMNHGANNGGNAGGETPVVPEPETPIVIASQEYPNSAHFGELIESKISCYGVDKWEIRISADTLLIYKELEDLGDSLSIFNCGDFDVYFGGDSDVSEYQGQTFIVDASYGDLMVTFGSHAGGKFYMEIFPMDADGNYIPWDADDVTINRW